jgi:CAAX protease family protein
VKSGSIAAPLDPERSAAAPGDKTSWLGGAWRVSVSLAPAALAEELLSRGYILSVLSKWWGWPWAIATTSIAFGALHIRNPGANLESIALVTIAGVFLGSIVYGTRSLYAAWAAHFAWNWTMAVAFHVAVSGLPLESPGYRYVDAGPNWATGGSWGPEGGVPAALTMIAGSVWLFSRRGRLKRSTGET